MRNSPFQMKQTSMLQTYDSSIAYSKHKAVIDTAKATPASPRDFISLVKEKNHQFKRTRQFLDHSRFREEERCNLRMLNRFVEIQRGRQLSVPRAIYKEHEQRSPVQAKHSLNFTKRKMDDMELLRSNLAMMKRLQKADSSTKFDDLQSKWTEKKRLRNMVSVPSHKRLNGLIPSGGQPHHPHLQHGLSSVTSRLQRGFDFAQRNQSLDPVANTRDNPVRQEMTKSRLQAEAQHKTHTENFNTIGATAGLGYSTSGGVTDTRVEQNEVTQISPPETAAETNAQKTHAPIAEMDQAAQEQEDLLKDKLMEVGSVQHQEDDHMEPNRLRSDLKNSTVENNFSSGHPSQNQFELIKNQSHTHDYNFFSGGSAHLLNQGNTEQGNSTLMEFKGRASSRKELLMMDKNLRKDESKKKVSKVYANPTIFKVHDHHTKLGSTQESDAVDPTLNHVSSSQRKISANLTLNKLKEIQNSLSPTYLSNFSTSAHNSPNHLAIQENLTKLKKLALQQDRLYGGSDHPITERKTVIDKINNLQTTQKLQLKFDLLKSPPALYEDCSAYELANITEIKSPASKKKNKKRDQKQVLDSLLHQQTSRNRPAELDLSKKSSINLLNSLTIAQPLSTRNNFSPNRHLLIAMNGTIATNESVRLLSEFKQAQGTAVSFPPISPQEALEKQRNFSLKRDFSNRQMQQLSPRKMKAMREGPPSQIMLSTGLDKSPSSKQLATNYNTGMKDPSSVVLNINRKFNKLNALTSEGTKVGYYMHMPEKAKARDSLKLLKLSQPKMPGLSSMSLQIGSQRSMTHDGSSEEQTKSMQKYQREIQFKNRVLREKEKAIFNKGVIKKLSKNQISTSDLMSDATLKNHRQPSNKHLLTMGSQTSIMASPLQVHQSIRDALNADIFKVEHKANSRSFKLSNGLQTRGTEAARQSQELNQQSQLRSMGITPEGIVSHCGVNRDGDMPAHTVDGRDISSVQMEDRADDVDFNASQS